MSSLLTVPTGMLKITKMKHRSSWQPVKVLTKLLELSLTTALTVISRITWTDFPFTLPMRECIKILSSFWKNTSHQHRP